MIRKIKGQWAVVHGHPKKKRSKTDKSRGTVIKKFRTKKKALAMHRAIILSQKRRRKKI